MREGHRQSDGHWNCFKGNFGETSERWDGARVGFSKCIDIPSRTEPNWVFFFCFFFWGGGGGVTIRSKHCPLNLF